MLFDQTEEKEIHMAYPHDISMFMDTVYIVQGYMEHDTTRLHQMHGVSLHPPIVQRHASIGDSKLLIVNRCESEWLFYECMSVCVCMSVF